MQLIPAQHIDPTAQPSSKAIDVLADEIINKLIDSDDPAVNTLALMLNKEALEAIKQGDKDFAEGKGIPLEDLPD